MSSDHSETTAQGEQRLIGGIRPITERDRLELLTAAPLRPRCAQKHCNIGLFDEDARNQLDILDYISKEPSP